jgi:hypothetical protein
MHEDTLPVQQVQAPQFPVHISYFLQKCKKANPRKRICPYDIQNLGLKFQIKEYQK